MSEQSAQRKKGGCLKIGLIIGGVFILLMGGCTVLVAVLAPDAVKEAVEEAEAQLEAEAAAESELLNDLGSGDGSESEASNSEETSKPKAKPKPKGPPAFSLKLFGQLETGMTVEEVNTLLGRKGELQSENEIGGYKTQMYSYKSGKRFDMANMSLTFQNGKLMSKAQFGLK